MNLVRDLFLL